MSNLNPRDIDELMRRASDKYPLRTDSADWNRLSEALDQDPSLILPPVGEDNERRRKRFLWWFLLLPLAIGLYYAWTTSGHFGLSGKPTDISLAPATKDLTASPVNGADKLASHPETAAAPAGSTATSTGSSTPAATTGLPTQSTGTSAPAAGAPMPATGSSAKPQGSPVQPSGRSGQPMGKPASATGSTASTAGSAPPTPGSTVTPPGPATATPAAGSTAATALRSNGKSRSSGSRVADAVARFQHQNRRGDGSNRPVRLSTPGTPTDLISPNSSTSQEPAGENGTAAGKSGIQTGEARSLTLKNHDDPLYSALTQQRVSLAPGISTGMPLLRTNTPAIVTPAKETKKTTRTRQSYLYAGVIIAPDFSLVKFQSVRKVGYNAGILLGYALNNKWSIETGVYLDKKEYYTSGEYYSTKSEPRLQNVKLKDVNGSCNMVEIPINVRYNLSSGQRMNWFATAGLSSYLMSNENYHYTLQNNSWSGAYSYPQSSRYWFSMINLSVGLEQKLGKAGQLRIEPYWRIPTSGIGRGDLPIMSAGLNIGFTRRIWK